MNFYKNKYALITGISVFSMVVFMLLSKTVISSVSYSLAMCYSAIIPSLFPYFIFCGFITKIAAATKGKAATAFITSQLAGFPSGARTVCGLYDRGALSKNNANRLLMCTVNASPAYLIAFIGYSLNATRQAGVMLFAAQLGASFVVALLFGGFINDKKCAPQKSVINLPLALSSSVTDAVTSCLNICGYVIFFGIIADILTSLGIIDKIARLIFFLPMPESRAFVIGIFELTRGVSAIGTNGRQLTGLMTLSMLIGFSGLSIIMQCIGFVVKSGLSPMRIVAGKLFYMLLMPLFTFALLRFSPLSGSGDLFNGHNPLVCFALFCAFIAAAALLAYKIFDNSNKKMYNIRGRGG